jgi:two-component system sensor histidine kinase/response regulator
LKIADEMTPEDIGDEETYLKRCNILVVDDNENDLEIISHTLKKHHVRFMLCQDSTRAFDFLIQAYEAKKPFTLAWLDIDMPKLNGIELAKKIRADKRLNGIRLIACTANIEKISDFPTHGSSFQSADSGLRFEPTAYFSFVASKPVSPHALQRILQEASTEDSTGVSECNLAGVRLLVVDDNPLNRFLVKNTMQNLGIEVQEAENGLDCLNKLEQNVFDVIIMDKMMPMMDGIEAIRLIRKTYDKDKLPILGFTADDSPEDKKTMLDAGANGILDKPIDYQKVTEMLCHVTRLFQS